MCSDKRASVFFKPCGHMVACDNCSIIMKKCVQCRTSIEEMVPLSVCCGGQGTVSKVSILCSFQENSLKFDVHRSPFDAPLEKQVALTQEEKNENDLVVGINKMGIGVAMNNTVPATPSNAPPINPATNVNNIQLDDVQKLQQQLQDIKEQVTEENSFIFSNELTLFILCRQCVQCASIESKTWFSYAAMARAKCAAIKSTGAPFAVKQSKNAYYSFRFIDVVA